MDVTITNVPRGCEDKVKEFAMMAIEMFIRERDMQVPMEVEEKFNSDVDEIRTANSMQSKFGTLKKI
jgi:hypothetical protein